MDRANTNTEVSISEMMIDGENYFKIANSGEMRPFFMSIVSPSNHWMFISSNGGLSAGRKNSEYSLFPYYTDDKITESAEITGSKTILHVLQEGKSRLWEPFSIRNEGIYALTQNLYKNKYGNKVVFEEVNHDLNLTFRYHWNSSDKFGFVKKSELSNNGLNDVEISILDGIQNILPYGVGSYIQNQSSNLVDAYKRSQLDEESGLGIFALSAIIVDKAEPSEALKVNQAWSLGLENPKYLLSSLQLKNFRLKRSVSTETDIKAEKGAYFVQSEFGLSAGGSKDWIIVADVNKNHAAIALASADLNGNIDLRKEVEEDIDLGTNMLISLNASSDAIQLSADKFRDARHFSNVLFNIMRGGIFDNNYKVEKWDFESYVKKANKSVYKHQVGIINELGANFNYQELLSIADSSSDPNFRRLIYEYMPLKFSRRHGDPSRPWNRFSINTRNEDGSKILDYEGNWRDIFQNWEALAYSYPDFIASMIHKFLNASTFDGYNPYRVTKDGFDWETIEPDDPWSYIGYWGDHQVIYLSKLLEFAQMLNPDAITKLIEDDVFVYANVPYRIKEHEDILTNPKDTIDFDEESDHQIRQDREIIGADGALIKLEDGTIYNVNFVEKILAMLLAKLSNFIPEGGIWMNTQRPEWNDANNALVGNGVSMVTLYYIRRFLQLFDQIISRSDLKGVSISEELHDLYQSISDTLLGKKSALSNEVDDHLRKSILDNLGHAASLYRQKIYTATFSGRKKELKLEQLSGFITNCSEILEYSIDSNKRDDNLYHAYNIMTIKSDDEVSISYLSEMLEGQVAALSSGYLSSQQVLEVLDGLKNSSLFRPDQYSYILYPNKELPTFMEKNNIPSSIIEQSKLLTQMLEKEDKRIVDKDINGRYHFNGNFKNAADLSVALNEISATEYEQATKEEYDLVLNAFEEIFDHKSFTGRSGTFYGYEGLGSIYWHMVSKLHLAVQECCIKAVDESADPEIVGRLLDHYYEINAGIGVHKSPDLYGAFPTDPYSHTPFGKGAQQPGMTGQVKEDILVRFGELGIKIQNGQLSFDPSLLKKDEFLTSRSSFSYYDVEGKLKTFDVDAQCICFTYCQVPVVYEHGNTSNIAISMSNGENIELEGNLLSKEHSQMFFGRTNEISKVKVSIPSVKLK